MKKLLFFGLLFQFLLGFDISTSEIIEPTIKINDILSPTIVSDKISTKISSKNFTLKILFNRPKFNYSNIKIIGYDKDLDKNYTLKEYSSGINVPNLESFNIPYCHKNYQLIITFVYDDKNYINYSDTFAIRPYKFLIDIKNGFTGARIKYSIKALTYKNEIDKNYNNNYSNLMVYFNKSTKYSIYFEILSGQYNGSSLIFYKSVEEDQMNIIDNNFSKIDENDTSIYLRQIKGLSNTFDIIEPTKYWSGVGTDEEENSPQKNTIQTNIRQHGLKDLRFRKCDW